MKLLFVGPQGSGKGTQAKIISKKLDIRHISTGDLLRNAIGELREEIDSYINQGKLVPDELIIKVLKKRIEEPDCKNGFILDGFPRNVEQVKYLDDIIELDKVILIDISDEKAVNRISSRLNCKKCGALFNSLTMIPKEKGICDSCGGELYIRDDDKPEAIKKRLEIYHKDTKPILNKYENIRIDGEQAVEKVTEEILKELE